MPRFFIVACLLICSCSKYPLAGETTISGTAVLIAPIVGAHVRITYYGPLSTETVGEGTTDKDGKFEIKIKNTVGTILVEVLGDQGGSTLSPISNKPLQLSLTDAYSNLMSGIELGKPYNGIVISPWSTLVSQQALWDFEANKTPITQALINSIKLFRDHFGGIEFISSVPVDPSAGHTNGLPSSAIHGFMTSALAVMCNDISNHLGITPEILLNVNSVTQMLADDIRADGVFDARGKNGPIFLKDHTPINAEYSRAFLGAALGSYLSSANNQSGIGLPDLTYLITAITSDQSRLYGNVSALTQSKGNGPKITVSSPTFNTTLKDHVLIIGSANTSIGVAGVDIFLDDKHISGGVRRSLYQVDFAENIPLTDGFHVVKVIAHDATGQQSDVTVTFQSDSTPPKIIFRQCLSFDDRARSDNPAVDPGHNTIRWNNPSAPDAQCNETVLSQNKEPYVFHTFAELAKSTATSSYLEFVPQDVGIISSPDSELIFNAGIYHNDTLVGQVATMDALPNSSTRTVFLSSEIFGPKLLNVSSADVLELRLNAIDNQGNTGTFSYFFILDLLPSPLKVIDTTPSTTSPERIESYSYANGNVTQAFDASMLLPSGLFVVQRYTITNVSDRNIAFSTKIQNGASLQASYSEWVGFVAGEFIEFANESADSYATTQDGLVTPTILNHWGDCRNDISDIHIQSTSLTDPVSIAVTTAGTPSCIKSNDILTTNPVGTANATWGVSVQTQNGDYRYASASGDYVINAKETLSVSFGFNKPTFVARNVTNCEPNYYYHYIEEIAQSFPFLIANGYSLTPLGMPFGIFASNRELMTIGDSFPTDRWNDSGWVDCSGISCGSSGCRTDNDQFVLRIQAPQNQFPDSHGSIWQRHVEREHASFALSRLTQPDRFAIVGSANITSTSSRLTTNSHAYDFTFALPIEQLNVNYLSRYTPHPASKFQNVIFTKGALP